MERGNTSIPKTKIVVTSRAYEIEEKELYELCGFNVEQLPGASPHTNFGETQISATVSDLEFLLTVAKELQSPMSVSMIRDLLKCRQIQ